MASDFRTLDLCNFEYRVEWPQTKEMQELLNDLAPFDWEPTLYAMNPNGAHCIIFKRDARAHLDKALLLSRNLTTMPEEDRNITERYLKAAGWTE